MEDYEIGTQQIIHVNYDNISYELKYMGQVVQIKGNLSDGGVYIKNITVSFVTNQRYINIDVSDYAEDNIKYYPVFIAGDFTSTHLESKCLYIASIKTLRLICDGLATTGQGETGNTLLLIPITTEDDVIEGATNGRYMGEYAPYYTKAEITTLLSGKQNTLTFDNTPTEDSTNPVTSGGVYTALSGKQGTLTFDSTPTQNSTNPVTSGGIYTALSSKQNTITGGASSIVTDNITAYRALASDSSGKVSATNVTAQELNRLSGVTSSVQNQIDGKQNTLTFDTTPTENSTNPVTSGGLYDVIGDVETLINAL